MLQRQMDRFYARQARNFGVWTLYTRGNESISRAVGTNNLGDSGLAREINLFCPPQTISEECQIHAINDTARSAPQAKKIEL